MVLNFKKHLMIAEVLHLNNNATFPSFKIYFS